MVWENWGQLFLSFHDWQKVFEVWTQMAGHAGCLCIDVNPNNTNWYKLPYLLCFIVHAHLSLSLSLYLWLRFFCASTFFHSHKVRVVGRKISTEASINDKWPDRWKIEWNCRHQANTPGYEQRKCLVSYDPFLCAANVSVHSFNQYWNLECVACINYDPSRICGFFAAPTLVCVAKLTKINWNRAKGKLQ